MITLIFILISNLSYIISPLILPFKTYNPLTTKDYNLIELIKKASDEQIVETILNNLIYIKIDVGNSKANNYTLSNNIDFFIYMAKNDFYLNILGVEELNYKKIKNYPNLEYNNYILLKSILNFTYYNFSLAKIPISVFYPYEKYDLVNETIYLNVNKNNSDTVEKIGVNIYIPFKNLILYDHRPGILGLSFHNYFILNIKNKIPTKTDYWIIKYNDIINEEGDLIIGDLPHIYDSHHYNQERIKSAKIYFGENMHPDWTLLFSKSFIVLNNGKLTNEIELKQNTFSLFRIEEFFILGTDEYFQHIQKIFFGNYINQSICQKQTHKKVKYIKNYWHIMCYFNNDKTKMIKFLNNFPILKFYQSEMNYNFTLDSNDLFTIIPDNNRILFNIEFFENNNNWVFGKPFFKKYKLIFNDDKKIISYYIEDENRYNNTNSYYKYSNYIVIIIICIFIYTFYFFCFNKKKKSNKKEDNNKSFELSEYLHIQK